MSAFVMDIVAAQGVQLEAAPFQTRLIETISKTLLRSPSPPCLLGAPTGSGKTFVMSQVLSRVCEDENTVWLWFVPFVNLVQQTEDELLSSATNLKPMMLNRGRNLAPEAGQVMLSTAQGVARKKDREAAYTLDGEDDLKKSLNTWLAMARSQELRIGLVVDEAHIGLDSVTEFGQFAKWLKPDYLLMATATPKDDKLLSFIGQSGLGAYQSFPVARADVVDARLNKRYIESVVYEVQENVRTITDLRATVLRQAWRRNLRLKRDLAKLGIPLKPLLLVQVGNGAKAIEEAQEDLINLCGVPPSVIGAHSADAPDPVLMASIANDPTKEVLIFKQSAGTGFNAPRAFVLASTKSVNDSDFAMQFIGRVMRVSGAIRQAYPKPTAIPDHLDTAYIYLANAAAQQGYELAVQTSQRIQSQLEGQTERLIVRTTRDGAKHYSNKATFQNQAFYEADFGEELSLDVDVPSSDDFDLQGQLGLLPKSSKNDELGQIRFEDFDLDEPDSEGVDGSAGEAGTGGARRYQRPVYASRAALMAGLTESRLTAYPKREDIATADMGGLRQLQRETQPELDSRASLARAVASRLELPESLRKSAVRAALNKLKEIERHTELTTGQTRDEEVLIITNREALADEAHAAMATTLGAEEDDIAQVVYVLASRLQGEIAESFEELDLDVRPDESALNRLARDAAYWVIRKEIVTLSEMLQSMVSVQTVIEDAAPLPDVMLFPTALPLAKSRKNVYGTMPPTQGDLDRLDSVLTSDERRLLADQIHTIDDGVVKTGRYDGTLKLNGLERQLAVALDNSDFVLWWHRNPDRKDYAVRIVRAEHNNYFYPDFVVCMTHFPGDSAMLRLIETKDDTKDAARKAQREPKFYGKVLFLTKDADKLKIVNDNGSVGDVVDANNLTVIREWMRRTIPVQ
jgi:type III restriction enzyme